MEQWSKDIHLRFPLVQILFDVLYAVYGVLKKTVLAHDDLAGKLDCIENDTDWHLYDILKDIEYTHDMSRPFYYRLG